MPSNNNDPQRLVHRQADPTLRAATDSTSPAAISAADAAQYCGLPTHRSMADLRQQGRGPAFIRLGYRTYVYRLEDLDAWLNERRIVPFGAQQPRTGRSTPMPTGDNDGLRNRHQRGAS